MPSRIDVDIKDERDTVSNMHCDRSSELVRAHHALNRCSFILRYLQFEMKVGEPTLWA